MSKTLDQHNYFGIDATIIADSVNEFGNRITTFVVTHPRHILAEVNTHRMLSRNSASSRAVPFKKMLKRVRENPFIPIAWQKDHKGMQGTEYLDEEKASNAASNWIKAANNAAETAESIHANYFDDKDSRVTKQLCNRLLEPFIWHTAIITATEYENFFHLRCPQYRVLGANEYFARSWKDYKRASTIKGLDSYSDIEKLQVNEGAGEIHIMALAEKMWDARNENTPEQLEAGDWHIPFGDNIDSARLDQYAAQNYLDWGLEDRVPYKQQVKYLTELRVKISTARCARISYINFEGKDDYSADVLLHDKLVDMGHWSPFEHCAIAMSEKEYNYHLSGLVRKDNNTFYCDESSKGWSGNFKGFIQYRKTFDNENITEEN